MCPRGRTLGQGRPRGLHLWKPIFKTHYASYQISKQKIIDFLQKLPEFENVNCVTSLGVERFYT